MGEQFKKFINEVKFPLLAIFLSFIAGSFFIIWTGNSPIVAYQELFVGSLGDMSKVGNTLLKSTPIILTGLSVAFAFRTGLFNIGAEGQYVMGALFTVASAWIFRGLPGFILIPVILLSGAIGGGLWAAIPGFLKAKMGINEVIVTIMLNYTGLFIANYCIRTVLNPSTLQGSEQKAFSVILEDHAKLTRLNTIFEGFGHSYVHTGIIIAVVVAVLVWYVLFKTTLGYELRSVGHNPYASEYGGINISRNIVLSMVIAGMLAGLAGATTIAGLTYKMDQSAGSPGYGFTGISVALVGKNHPLGVIASGLLFGILANGERKMQIAGIPKEVVGIIQGIIIIFIAGEAMFKYLPGFKKKESKGEVK